MFILIFSHWIDHMRDFAYILTFILNPCTGEHFAAFCCILTDHLDNSTNLLELWCQRSFLFHWLVTRSEVSVLESYHKDFNCDWRRFSTTYVRYCHPVYAYNSKTKNLSKPMRKHQRAVHSNIWERFAFRVHRMRSPGRRWNSVNKCHPHREKINHALRPHTQTHIRRVFTLTYRPTMSGDFKILNDSTCDTATLWLGCHHWLISGPIGGGTRQKLLIIEYSPLKIHPECAHARPERECACACAHVSGSYALAGGAFRVQHYHCGTRGGVMMMPMCVCVWVGVNVSGSDVRRTCVTGSWNMRVRRCESLVRRARKPSHRTISWFYCVMYKHTSELITI